MPEPKAEAMQSALVHSQHLLRDSAIISNLLRIITIPGQGIEHSLRSVRDLYHADAAYLCFFREGTIISMDFQATDQTINFTPPAGMQIPRAVNREPENRSGGSLLGDVPFISSFSYPLLSSNNKLVGLLEVGQFHSTLDPAAFSHFTATLRKIENAYLLVYDREIKVNQLISARKELKESQNRIEVIYSDSKDLIASLDRTGKILDVNPAGCALLGCPFDHVPDKIPLISPTMEFIMAILDRQALISDLEIILESSAGNPVFGLASFSTAFEQGQPIIYAIVKNITDRVKMQQELQTVNLELSEANQSLMQHHSQMVQQEKLASIGELAAGVAHEINNPLAFVSSNFKVFCKYFGTVQEYAKALENLAGVDQAALASLKTNYKIDRISADARAIIDESEDGFDRIIAIIKSLKDFSRVDAAGALSMVDLNLALKNTITIGKSSWKTPISIVTDFQVDQPAECCASEINQVFLNIIINAAQAIEETQLARPGKITISTSRHGQNALIKIADNGPGIPANVKSRIFNPFFTTKAIGKGTGLGLSISYDIIVNKHGGRLSVESEAGVGSCFSVLLPLQSAAGARDLASLKPE